MTFLFWFLAYYIFMFIIGIIAYVWHNIGEGKITFGEMVIIGLLTPSLLIFLVLIVIVGIIFGAISSIINIFK